jgi:hypothetical protein
VTVPLARGAVPWLMLAQSWRTTAPTTVLLHLLSAEGVRNRQIRRRYSEQCGT